MADWQPEGCLGEPAPPQGGLSPLPHAQECHPHSFTMSCWPKQAGAKCLIARKPLNWRSGAVCPFHGRENWDPEGESLLECI